jgi:carbonic anhydrase
MASSILSLKTKVDIINQNIQNNPFYVNVLGSINICLVRCGQEIQNCGSVKISSMTNYEKILVLHTESTNTCSIKLAFDSSNDNVSPNGEGQYTLENIFFTVPSLHRLNGVLYDCETFMLFSSIQKNGDKLFVCLCSLSNGTDKINNDDWKLVNYKLMNELFVKNTIPNINETKSISNITSIDLLNLIPIAGQRSFYDYSHPSNPKLNIKIYQTPMAISMDVLNQLKSKLTPGNTYKNFHDAIRLQKNPDYGLFFYYSQDLGQSYKSISSSDDSSKTIGSQNENKVKEKFDSVKEKEREIKESEPKKEVKEEVNKEANKEEKEENNEEDNGKMKEKFDSPTDEEDVQYKNKKLAFVFGLMVTILANVLFFSFAHSLMNVPVDNKEIVDYHALEGMVKDFVHAKFRYIFLIFMQIVVVLCVLFHLYTSKEKWNFRLCIYMCGLFMLSSASVYYLFKYIGYRTQAMQSENNERLSIIDSTEIMLRSMYSNKNNNIMSGGGNELDSSPIPPVPPVSLNMDTMIKSIEEEEFDFTKNLQNKMEKYNTTSWVVIGFIVFLFVFSCMIYFYVFKSSIASYKIEILSILFIITIYFIIFLVLYLKANIGDNPHWSMKYTIGYFGEDTLFICLLILLFVMILYTMKYVFYIHYESFIYTMFFSNYMSVFYIPFLILLGLMLYNLFPSSEGPNNVILFMPKMVWYYIVYFILLLPILFLTFNWGVACLFLIFIFLCAECARYLIYEQNILSIVGQSVYEKGVDVGKEIKDVITGELLGKDIAEKFRKKIFYKKEPISEPTAQQQPAPVTGQSSYGEKQQKIINDHLIHKGKPHPAVQFAFV